MPEVRYAHDSGHLTVVVRNDGAPINATVELRVVAMEAIGGGGFTFDRTYQIPVNLAPGATHSLVVEGFRWPAPLIDHPQLALAVQVDPGGRIAEGNERNNHFETSVCAPCGVHIDGVNPPTALVGQPERICLSGRFGTRQASKSVYFERQNQRVPGEGAELLSSGAQWCTRTPQNLPRGDYTVTVYCCDPAVDARQKSNSVRFGLRDRTCPSGSEGCLDSRAQADALSEDMAADGISFDIPPAVETVSTTRPANGTGIIGRCDFRPGQGHRITTILHQLLQNGRSVMEWRLTGPSQRLTDLHWVSEYRFNNVAAGQYQYRCTVRAEGGKQSSATTSFTHSP